MKLLRLACCVLDVETVPITVTAESVTEKVL